MKKLILAFVLAFFIIILFFENLSGETSDIMVSNPNTQYMFLNAEEAVPIIGNNDDYVMSLSPFDRASRVKSNSEVSTDAYLSYVLSQTLNWNQLEMIRLNNIMSSVREKLDRFKLIYPDTVYFIKTTGKEEGNSAYCRQNAIVFPKAVLASDNAKLEKLIIHELFHIYSRNNMDVRESLYNMIGYYRCPELEFPKELASLKITNPDAPKNNYYIELNYQGADYKAIPVLYSEKPFNVSDNREFFSYMKYNLLAVEIKNNKTVPLYKNGKLLFVEENQQFFEKVGSNTDYTISPEEILADNFILMIDRETNVKSPLIIEGMKRIIGER